MNPPRLLPGRADLRDAAFLAALFLLALLGFVGTYLGVTFLLVGLTGLVLGTLVGHLANSWRQPVITVAFLTLVVFFLLGGAIAARERVVAGVLPTPDSVLGLADAGVHSWKRLLTTLPPVDGSGHLLVIPYILGLLCGAGGFTLARRVSLSAAPLVAPVGVLVAVILLGTAEPPAQPVRAVAFAAVSVTWAGLRGRRRHAAPSERAVRRGRVVTGAVLLGVAGSLATVLGPLLPGASSTHRVVLRDFVEPPFQVGAYPSPLVGFRKYTKDANRLWDQALLTVRGLPEGQRVRIAALDDYDGSVWRATQTDDRPSALAHNNFQRVGRRIPAPLGGVPATVTFTVEAAYATAEDLSAWLPGAGSPTEIDFDGDRAAAHADSLRFNLATSSGIVADRLRTGDSYTVHTVLTDDAIPEDPQPFGRPSLAGDATALVTGKVSSWAGGANSLGEKLRAVAAYLREHGAFSSGGSGETQYLPGHNIGRLSAFFNGERPVGDDEQYAAAFALVANHLGMPARVVVGAAPGPDGVVRGQHVQAWVEIHLADGQWATIANTEFMPDRSKKPDSQPPQEIENTDASVVPPPNTVHPPGTLTDSTPTDGGGVGPDCSGCSDWELPGWLVVVLTWAGPPVLAAGSLAGVIAGAKAVRRRLRRTRGPAVARFATGWRELVDHARDLGARVPGGQTRAEEANLLGAWGIGQLAAVADATIFGPGSPPEGDAARYWTGVAAARREMSRRVGRARRWRAAVSLRSLRHRVREARA